MTSTLGSLVRSFFEDHLTVQKGLRPASVRSYADALRLFLSFCLFRRLRTLIPIDCGQSFRAIADS
jgi:hypothetical protein